MRHHQTFGAPRIALLTIISISLAAATGCGGYGEVSPKTYEYATALYSICNRQDSARLEKFSSMLDEARQSDEISSQEADWLADIVERARRGDWERAASMSRRMLSDQVEGGP